MHGKPNAASAEKTPDSLIRVALLNGRIKMKIHLIPKTYPINLALGCLILLINLAVVVRSPAQDGPPALPEVGMLLNKWSFDTNYLSTRGDDPKYLFNVDLVPSFDSMAARFVGDGPALMEVNYLEPDGHTNFNNAGRGSWWLWYRPLFDGTNPPSDALRLIEWGAWTSDADFGWLSLYCYGGHLIFGGQSNFQEGVFLDYDASAYLSSNAWTAISLNFTPTNTALYINGALVTNSGGVLYWPGDDVLRDYGMCIGSTAAGWSLAQGDIDEVMVFDGQRPASMIYWYYTNTLARYMGSFGAGFSDLQQFTDTPVNETQLWDETMESAVLATGLRLGMPVWWQGTNLQFAVSNSTPECPCNLQFATNLSPPIKWTTLVQGTNYQTNFFIAYTQTNQGFFRLQYKSYIQATTQVDVAMNGTVSINTVTLLQYPGTNNASLSFTAMFGILRLGITNGLSFTAGSNGWFTFTVSGSYSSLTSALPSLSYTGYFNFVGTDYINLALANIGTNGTCTDAGAVAVKVHSPPWAYYISASGIQSISTNIFDCGCCFDPEGNSLSAVPQHISTSTGLFDLQSNGNLTYYLWNQDASGGENFNYQVYSTFGNSLHSTSSVAMISVWVDPPTPPPPSVTIVSPANNAIFTQGSIVNVSVVFSGTTNACSISQVDYYSGTNKIGTVTTTPFSFAWNNAPPGTNLLTATASSWCGMSTSAVVSVFIDIDSDGDGISDSFEALTNRYDYFNGLPPVVQVSGGDFQSGSSGSILPLPFRALITTAGGIPLSNAPVTFTSVSGGGSLSYLFQSNWQSTVTVRADGTGTASAQFKLPNTTNTYCYISAQAPNSTNYLYYYTNSTVTFVAVSTNQAGASSAYLQVYTPLK